MNVYVIDANVILLAGTMIKDVPEDQLICFEKCVRFLEDVKKQGGMVLMDDEGLILEEYRYAFKISRYPNMAAVFFEYVLGKAVYYHLVHDGKDNFEAYPDDKILRDFDPPDRKYIALSYGYKKEVPIIEATDSKWWEIRDILKNYGIELIFVDEEYISSKYQKKMMKKKF